MYLIVGGKYFLYYTIVVSLGFFSTFSSEKRRRMVVLRLILNKTGLYDLPEVWQWVDAFQIRWNVENDESSCYAIASLPNNPSLQKCTAQGLT